MRAKHNSGPGHGLIGSNSSVNRGVMARLLAAVSIASLVMLGVTPLANSAQIPVPDTVEKTANPPSGSSVTPGQVITYTIKATRGNTDRENWLLNDNLGEVLNNATLVGNWPEGTEFFQSGNQPPILSWVIPTGLEPGESASISFQVRVNDNANGAVIRNVIASWATNCLHVDDARVAAQESPGPGSEVGCETTHPVIAVAPPVVTVPAPAPAKPPVVRIPRSLPHTGA